ncbi:phosphoenolpyruvate--protein phosphotransferase [Schinkia azotoformans]|uniref:Phosphoenolpyruvate-protein phosphotransferase n=1 Tax=Schinkia azotoformans LMG 9581 TaxID=1131731 RepID=K6CT82_SCHAZ|nr:phosphoenolpyruvate--protein phosphotransferase [Schinkia azotoformans]EKN63462.1 phosphoenolpyruvate-protein phosphotransferase [Schinkia azotoformans LMG 9581]MEC1638761.1 phosphoenolpyruvate--protein phosphotransferase [Schinkia azotoformans]MEC1946726.1 phosphoenolpyruvate--protein phosphotransferase [Schinkia azotoformans]MED4353262.1 phosphoenolpyruvate--protein phosphotransferase [Schinkia azotoformans]
MSVLKGIAASQGIAIAKACKLVEPDLSFDKKTITDTAMEVERFRAALSIAKEEVVAIHKKSKTDQDGIKAAIFEAHLLILTDPELILPIEEKIKTEKVNVEQALQETVDMHISMFKQMDNDYMKERAADIHDVVKRVLIHLLGTQAVNLSLVSEEVIIVAEDLTPSDTAQLNHTFIKGFTTNMGGRTSHSAIMARSMEIPAVVGTKTATEEIENGDLIIVDGIKGEVHINPTPETLTYYENEQIRLENRRLELTKFIQESTISADGHQVKLTSNIETPNDLESVINNGAEGIGLFRTEFLYMGRSQLPSEEEQFESYKAVLEAMNGKPVVVRTIDIGGDKELPYLEMPMELNPFLGFRAIRLCLERKDIFRTQLRALLRASTYGNLKIMFPMIATLDEFREVTKILQEEKQKLIDDGVAVRDHIELGIMIEIPSAALMADQFAKEVDFFSIGSNDLIQYTMAADRMNERVSYLYQPYSPAILRLVKMVINAAHHEGKWVGMCGEMAGDETAIPLLLGLSLDEFSMSSSSILKARSQILRLSKKDMGKLVEKAVQMGTTKEVVELVNEATSGK